VEVIWEKSTSKTRFRMATIFYQSVAEFHGTAICWWL